jgi:hypothetical protein
MTLVVTTLFEAGNYEEGVRALLHSLRESGYEGQVMCGVRGIERSQLARTFEGGILGGRIELAFSALSTEYHLSNYKPHFMLEVASRRPEVTHIVYFDPDLVVKCGWSFVARWCREKIAAVADENWFMPRSSPIRAQWRDLAERLQVRGAEGVEQGALDLYCNAGFVGLPIRFKGFLELWADLIDSVLREGTIEEQRLVSREGAETVGVSDGRMGSVKQIDQELFNVALMEFEDRLSLMGPEAMDFASGGRIFSHATGSPKPWNRDYIRMALRGYPPSKRDLEVLRKGAGQLSLVSDGVHRRRLVAYRLARVMGSVIKKTDF